MSIGQAYSDILSTREKKAMQIACDLLIDEAFSELSNVQNGQDIVDTTIGGYLPHRYVHKYTPIFFKQFTVCLIMVTWKLAQTQPIRLSSLAEELAAWVIIQESQRILQDVLEDAGDKDDLNTFVDMFFEDLDFMFLFENAFDGIEETAFAQIAGMESLAFADWFKPFSDDPDRIVHPYTV